MNIGNEVNFMGCNCKDNQEAIRDGKKNFAELRELFIKRMTIDSDHNDRRRKDYNQAIFHYEYDDEEFIAPENTYQVWCNMDMAMVLQCFDDAVKDWRRSWCDVENCTRK